MRQIFYDTNAQAVLLVDASNAFNNLNRQTALQNILLNCPSIAKVLSNTYRDDSQLIADEETLFSMEGTTQGDPLAMAMYAISTLPLIRHLNQKYNRSGTQTMPQQVVNYSHYESGGTR